MFRVGPLTVHVGDRVVVDGRLREVVDMKLIGASGVGRLLRFPDGRTYQLLRGQELDAEREKATANVPAGNALVIEADRAFSKEVVQEQRPADLVVASYLRWLRVKQGKGIRHAAAVTGLSVSKISRIETGKVRPSDEQVACLMRAYRANGWAQLRNVRLLLEEGADQLPHAACDHLPGRMVRLTAVERQAVSVRSFNGLFVPGMLQVPEYTWALLKGSPSFDWQDEAAAHGRRVSLGSLPHIEAVLDESILWRPVGGPAAMAKQLAHLDEAIESGANIRVARFNACVGGGHTHLAKVAFRSHIAPLFFTESSADVLYTNGPHASDQAGVLREALKQSEPAERSRELLAEARTRFRQEAA